MSKPRHIVICGPSGSGKSTILKKLFDEYGKYVGFSISHTTRQPRPGEMNHREYHFVGRDEMEKSISTGEIIEYTQYSGNLYGTSKAALVDVEHEGKICILDVNLDGVQYMKKSEFRPVYVFIKPKSLQVLEERLRGRGTETEESLKKRLETAKSELEFGETPGNFDAIIVNDDLDEAYDKFKAAVIGEIKLLMDGR